MKALLIAEDGEPLGEGSAAYHVRSPNPGWAESFPEDWWDAVARRRGTPWRARARVTAIGLSGPDARRRPLRRPRTPLEACVLWADTRSGDQPRPTRARRRRQGEAGQPARRGHGGADAAVAARARARGSTPRALGAPAQGLAAVSSHRGGCGGSLRRLRDPALRPPLRRLGYPWSRPWTCGPTCSPRSCLREIAAELHRRGRRGARVEGQDSGRSGGRGHGGGAARLRALAARRCPAHGGDRRPDHGRQSRGRSRPHLRTHLFGRRFPTSATRWRPSRTPGWRWSGYAACSARPGTTSTRGLRRAPGRWRRLFLPYLSGERTPRFDPDARGAWVGLGLDHGRGHLLRAALEGVASPCARGSRRSRPRGRRLRASSGWRRFRGREPGASFSRTCSADRCGSSPERGARRLRPRRRVPGGSPRAPTSPPRISWSSRRSPSFPWPRDERRSNETPYDRYRELYPRLYDPPPATSDAM